MKENSFKYFAALIFVTGWFTAHSNIITVTNTADSGPGSLRYALTSAILITSPDTINFNIPTSDPNYNSTLGVWLIHPLSTYEYIINSNLIIDATTQILNHGNTNPYGPEVVIDGGGTVDYCFSVMNASRITIKGFTISRFLYGIQMYGASSTHNLITGNYIGTDPLGTDTAGNYIGIELAEGADSNTIGGTTIADRNLISGNQHIGLRFVDVTGDRAIGNLVGTDRTGTRALGNYDGVSIEGASTFNTVGGATANERNIVSGNIAYGIPVFGAGAYGNVITGNYIGTDITGIFAIPNTYGVLFDDGSSGNILGGGSAAERNILSGNSGYGVFIYNMGTNRNTVKGNYIGAGVNGTSAVPNGVGIVIDGTTYSNIIDSNIISGNVQQGIYIHITGSDSNRIINNKIGVDINNAPMGNGQDGIRIAEGASYNRIGGTPAEGNIIANNGANGIYLIADGTNYNLISCNSIYDNAALGIELYPQGVNPNYPADTATTPNKGMNYPVIDTVIFNTGTGSTIVSGTLYTQNPGVCTIQVFKAIPGATGYGQGSEYLSSVIPDPAGNWSDTIPGLTPTDFLTTTAIDPLNNTSGFSRDRNTISIATGIENPGNDGIKIYPNPSNGKFILQTGDTENGVITVFNMFGETIFQDKITNGEAEINMNVSGGVYFYRVSSGKQFMASGKLVLQ